MGQTSLLNFQDVAILVLDRKRVEMDDTGDSGGHQRRKTESGVDEVEKSRKDKIVVVSLSVSVEKKRYVVSKDAMKRVQPERL